VPLIDFLLLTPLDEEWRTMFPLLCPDLQRVKEVPVDSITYYTWAQPVTTLGGKGEYLIAAASIADRTPGQALTASFVTNAVATWRPDTVLLTGIAGSLDPDRVKLGDVIVGRDILGYEVEDALDSGFNLRKTYNQIDARQLDRMRALVNLGRPVATWQDQCKEAAAGLFPAEEPRRPSLFIEAIASGNKVVKSTAFAQELQRVFQHQVGAVEMEARGLHQALYLDAKRRDGLVVRGISDYADKYKSDLERRSNDAWRTLAAGNAARLIAIFWQRGSIAPISPGYRLNLQRGSFQQFRQGPETQIDFQVPGAHDLAFPILLERSAPTPAITLEIAAEARAGGAATGFRGTCIVNSPDRLVVQGQETEPGHMRMSLPASEWGLRVDLLLSFPTPIARLSIRCSDLFGRAADSTLATDS
jgi:nucleoside phosphorylase